MVHAAVGIRKREPRQVDSAASRKRLIRFYLANPGGTCRELPVLYPSWVSRSCEAIACFMIYEGEAVHFSLAMPALTASHSSAFRIPTRAAALWQSNFG